MNVERNTSSLFAIANCLARVRWSACLVGLVVAHAVSANELSFDARARVLGHWIDEQIEYHGMPGVVVALVDRNGPRWSGAFGVRDLERGEPLTASTRFRMGSVSKIFTATALMVLRDEGHLDLDDPVTKHLPWFSLRLRDVSGSSAAGVDAERYRADQLDGSQVTLRHLLTHTGGLPREAAVPYWTDHVFPDRQRLVSVVRSQQALWPPGHRYQYSNLGLGLLGQVIESVTGESYQAVLASRLFEPLGMERSTAAPNAGEQAELAVGYMRRMPDGTRSVFEYYDTAALAGAANVVSTLDDMAKFAQLHLAATDAGRVGSAKDPVAAESLREMHRSHWLRDSFRSARGLGFSVTSREGERVASHGGWIAGHRSHLVVIPERGVAVVAMVNADDVSPSFFAYAALDALEPALGSNVGRAVELSPPDEVPIADWTALEGTYSDPWGSYYETMQLDDSLYFYEHSYPPSDRPLASLTRLVPEADGFVFGTARDPVRFEREAGVVVRVLRRSDYLFPVASDGSFEIDLP